eukprot:5924221-Amphidinium_carterae.1
MEDKLHAKDDQVGHDFRHTSDAVGGSGHMKPLTYTQFLAASFDRERLGLNKCENKVTPDLDLT